MTDKSKATINRYDLATRHGAKQYNGYDVLDCSNCMPFGGSGTHELIRRNPTAHLLLASWQVDDLTHLLEWINEDERIPIKPTVTYEVVKVEE